VIEDHWRGMVGAIYPSQLRVSKSAETSIRYQRPRQSFGLGTSGSVSRKCVTHYRVPCAKWLWLSVPEGWWRYVISHDVASPSLWHL